MCSACVVSGLYMTQTKVPILFREYLRKAQSAAAGIGPSGSTNFDCKSQHSTAQHEPISAQQTCRDKVPLVFWVLEALEEACCETQGGGLALTEGSSNHGPYVNHGPLWPYRQSTAHCCRTGYELHPQCAHIEHLHTYKGC